MVAEALVGRVVARLVDRLGAAAEPDAPLGPLTTYRVGGPAAALVRVEDEVALIAVAEVVAGSGVDVLVIGRGSNLLVADAGFNGIALHLGERFAGIVFDGTTMTAGGATPLPVVARQSVQEGLTGFEWAVGVPGSVGGAVRMNAGGHGAAIVDSIVGARVIDLDTGVISDRSAASLELGYRSSSLTSSDLVIDATFALAVGDVEAGRTELNEIVRWRRANQPGGQNAGSVFANPPGESAGRLIEIAGGKGLRIGTAEVSTKHANFIQVDEGGSADDIRRVMLAVEVLVHEVDGIRLQVETHLVGFPADTDPTDSQEGG